MTCNFKNIFLSIFATLNFLAAAQPDEQSKETLVMLTAPVEIQGVVLPAGRYLFKLVDDDSSHQTIQIFNGEQSEPVAVFPAVSADDEEGDVDDPDVESAPDLPSEIVVIPPDDDDDDYECAPQEDDDGTITLTATVDDTGVEATEESADDVNGAPAQPTLPAPRL
jgi:hypothetical protein